MFVIQRNSKIPVHIHYYEELLYVGALVDSNNITDSISPPGIYLLKLTDPNLTSNRSLCKYYHF